MILGRQLYPKIAALEPDLSSKITQMILELDIEEILLRINNKHLLEKEIDEAKNLISLYQDEI